MIGNYGEFYLTKKNLNPVEITKNKCMKANKMSQQEGYQCASANDF
jgi:hypothetical protein